MLKLTDDPVILSSQYVPKRKHSESDRIKRPTARRSSCVASSGGFGVGTGQCEVDASMMAVGLYCVHASMAKVSCTVSMLKSAEPP
jgi:hypothetical protein